MNATMSRRTACHSYHALYHRGRLSKLKTVPMTLYSVAHIGKNVDLKIGLGSNRCAITLCTFLLRSHRLLLRRVSTLFVLSYFTPESLHAFRHWFWLRRASGVQDFDCPETSRNICWTGQLPSIYRDRDTKNPSEATSCKSSASFSSSVPCVCPLILLS